MLRVFYMLIHVIITVTHWERYCCYLHHIREVIWVLRCEAMGPRLDRWLGTDLRLELRMAGEHSINGLWMRQHQREFVICWSTWCFMWYHQRYCLISSTLDCFIYLSLFMHTSLFLGLEDVWPSRHPYNLSSVMVKWHPVEVWKAVVPKACTRHQGKGLGLQSRKGGIKN